MRLYVTGKIEGMTKNEVKEFCESKGFDFSSSITGKTDLLVTGEKPGASRLAKAKELNIRVITWNEFLKEYVKE
ncbi:MAG: BRCT domain-containing protein [Candidatus Heimdallarchaeaceae archaeon]